jgi:hypothetical protein
LWIPPGCSSPFFAVLIFSLTQSFSEYEFNAENIKYIIEITSFRDAFRIDRVSWSKPYQVIDRELQDLSPSKIPTEWPSAYLSESAVKECIDRIHALFIHSDADSQICLPSDVLERTERRIERVNLYGPETFEESLIDPIKTMKRDILPRFLRSTFALDMRARLKSVEVLPSASELELPVPPDSLTFQSAEEIPVSRRFHLKELVENRFLYGKFLSYLQQCFCSENLVCYRMVTLFEEFVRAKRPPTAIADLAWDIYRFFVADGAVYEISIEFASRKAIMLQLAKPKLETFEFVKRTSLSMLKTIYVSFKSTAEYAELAHYLRSKYSRGPLLGCLPISANSPTAKTPAPCSSP